MSIFGDLDVADINDNPYYTAPATYWANIKEAKYKTNEAAGTTSLVLVWKIDEPGNEFNGNQVQEQFLLPLSGVSREDQPENHQKSMKFLKQRLRRAFDLSEQQMATISPEELLGEGAYITTRVTEGTGDNEGKSFTNIANAVCRRLHDEDAEKTSGSLGL